jgi:hypothetical protein
VMCGWTHSAFLLIAGRADIVRVIHAPVIGGRPWVFPCNQLPSGATLSEVLNLDRVLR